MVQVEITYRDGQRAVKTPITTVAFASADDACERLAAVAYETLTETPDACIVVARTPAYPLAVAEACYQGNVPLVTSGIYGDDA